MVVGLYYLWNKNKKKVLYMFSTDAFIVNVFELRLTKSRYADMRDGVLAVTF